VPDLPHPQLRARGVPTKLNWDWSTAGKMGPDGKPMTQKDAKGHVTYDSRKGDFILGENVVPEYYWFNGKVTYTLPWRQGQQERCRHPDQPHRGQPQRRQVDDLADEGDARHSALRPSQSTLVMPHTAATTKSATGRTSTGKTRLPTACRTWGRLLRQG